MNTDVIYFDQAAAMRPDDAVLDFFRDAAGRAFANQEAGHGAGYQLRRDLDAAGRELVASVTDRERLVAWGSSGTELFNMVAALGMLAGGNVVLSPLEHPALPAALSRSGAELRVLPMRNGRIDWEKGAELFDRQTRLVALFHVQSELGLILDISPARALIAERSPKALLLCDTIQSAGKLNLPAEADLLTVSGHKLGAPGGAALLFDPGKLNSALLDAMRHRDYRFARAEPAMAFSLAFAARLRKERRQDELTRVTAINALLRREMTAIRMPNGKSPVATLEEDEASPYIAHFRLPGYQSAVVVRMLSEYKVYVASGSACQAESDRPSPALAALGFGRNDGYSGLRLSFGASNTLEEAVRFVELFQQVIAAY